MTRPLSILFGPRPDGRTRTVHLVKSALNLFGWDVVHAPNWKRILQDCDSVADVGANIGQTYDRFRSLGWQGPIVSFEPNPATFQKLLAKPGKNWTRLQFALGAKQEMLDWYEEVGVEHSESNSLHYRPADLKQRIAGKVQVCRLDSFKEITGQNIFLKIDAEGHDLEVLKGAGGLLDRVSRIQMEVFATPLYIGAPTFSEVIGAMAGFGFEVDMISRLMFSKDKTHGIAMDVLFRRRKP